MKKIVSVLPRPKRYEKIVEAYESRASREAQFAKAIDCLDSCVRNLNDDNKSKSDGFTEDLIRNEYYPHVSKFELTRVLFESMMERLRQQNKV